MQGVFRFVDRSPKELQLLHLEMFILSWYDIHFEYR